MHLPPQLQKCNSFNLNENVDNDIERLTKNESSLQVTILYRISCLVAVFKCDRLTNNLKDVYCSENVQSCFSLKNEGNS